MAFIVILIILGIIVGLSLIESVCNNVRKKKWAKESSDRFEKSRKEREAYEQRFPHFVRDVNNESAEVRKKYDAAIQVTKQAIAQNKKEQALLEEKYKNSPLTQEIIEYICKDYTHKTASMVLPERITVSDYGVLNNDYLPCHYRFSREGVAPLPVYEESLFEASGETLLQEDFIIPIFALGHAINSMLNNAYDITCYASNYSVDISELSWEKPHIPESYKKFKCVEYQGLAGRLVRYCGSSCHLVRKPTKEF